MLQSIIYVGSLLMMIAKKLPNGASVDFTLQQRYTELLEKRVAQLELILDAEAKKLAELNSNKDKDKDGDADSNNEDKSDSEEKKDTSDDEKDKRPVSRCKPSNHAPNLRYSRKL